MRIFSDCIDAAKEVERDLIEMGIENHPQTMQDIDVAHDENFKTKELMSYSYSIQKPSLSLQAWVAYFKLNTDWLAAEFLERIDISGVNPGTAWKIRESVWRPFLHNGKFSYTYSERMGYQLEMVIQELKERPSTRQAVISIYQGIIDYEKLGGKARVPCSMHYQFMRRMIGGKDVLGLIYSMRSCDFYLHYPYDVALAAMLLNHVKVILNCHEGMLVHNIGSLHAYAKDYSKKGIF